MIQSQPAITVARPATGEDGIHAGGVTSRVFVDDGTRRGERRVDLRVRRQSTRLDGDYRVDLDDGRRLSCSWLVDYEADVYLRRASLVPDRQVNFYEIELEYFDCRGSRRERNGGIYQGIAFLDDTLGREQLVTVLEGQSPSAGRIAFPLLFPR